MSKVYEDENIELHKDKLHYDIKSKHARTLTNFTNYGGSGSWCSFDVKWQPINTAYAYEFALAA